MRIIGRESHFCSGSTGWHFCWQSLDENHNLRPCMQKWWESPYENQNCEHWKNKTFRHSGRPKWNPPDTERSLKTRIAKKKWNRVHTERSFFPNFIRMFCHFCRPAWHREKPHKVNLTRGLVLWFTSQWSARAGAGFGTYSLFREISASVTEVVASEAPEPPDVVHLAQQ